VLVPEKISATSVTAAPSGPATAAVAASPVHLNSATAEQLDELPGVGPATAQRIIDYRTTSGPFKTVDELDSVSGIGPAKLAELRDLVVP
jgi:competence protein ComEA